MLIVPHLLDVIGVKENTAISMPRTACFGRQMLNPDNVYYELKSI